MLGNGHVQFGERAEETDQPKGWNRASVRLHQRGGRPHVATWAEAGVVTAADLLAGDEDPRPGAGSLIERSVATLRAAGVTTRPKVRGDVGYFAKDIAWAAVEAGCDFSLGVTRNPAAWRAAGAIPERAWRKARHRRRCTRRS